MRWVANNYELISALTSLGMLLVWIVYLQVFVSSYRRQLRATMLIARGAGDGLDARCFLSNMSSGPVYVQSVIATVETAADTLICATTDMDELEGELPADTRQRTRQGPLNTGDLRDIGSFRTLVRRALGNRKGDTDREICARKVEAVTVEVLGTYGSEDLLVGARRRFNILGGDTGIRIVADGVHTEQIRTRHERKKLAAELEYDP